MNKYCFTCKKDVHLKEQLHKATNNMIMVRGSCPFCGRWIKWIPYADSELVKRILLEKFNRRA
jgi:endogenous inhibitor of DNA gyrase (YacG/DUF329 family)